MSGTESPTRHLLARYVHARASVLVDATPSDARELIGLAARLALEDTVEWVGVVREDRRVSWCARTHEHDVSTCAQGLSDGLDLEGALSHVATHDEPLAWPEDGSSRGLLLPLLADGRREGVVVLARSAARAPFTNEEISALSDLVTALAVDLERLALRHEARRTLRASQRVASQLHQLISASLVVGSLDTAEEIALNLARSARSVFDADRAIIALEGPAQGVAAVAVPGRAPRMSDPSDTTPGELLAALPPDSTTVEHLGWLIAPIEAAGRARDGVLAYRRDEGQFSTEDRELATLLAQLAASTLAALDLNRTIRDSETRLRVLVDAAPIAIVETARGEVRWWNRAASRLLRWGEVGADAHPTWPSSVATRLSELHDDLLRGGTVNAVDLRADVGGRERLLAVSCAVVPSDATGPHVLTLLDDVTDQRQLREEVRHAQRMELRGQVASSIAHDFNNLITLILGYAELLGRSVEGDERAEELVRDIQSTSSRASTLTAQLQSVGRTAEPAPVSLDVADALGANAEVLERVMGSRVNVVFSLAPTPPVVVDADLFEQMILNLAVNARDAMPDGGTLSVATAVRSDAPANLDGPGDYVVISLADTGVGMDEETLARCFEPLFTTKGPFRGTGLGLASARRLVAESEGTIECVSRVGEGTRFDVWLPVAVDSDIPAPDAPTPTPVARARIEATILLVEDDEGLRRLARQVLVRNGFVVHETVSAEDALDVASRTEDIDLLVTDVVLGGMEGTELAALLQRDRPDLVTVVVSGTAAPEDLAHLDASRTRFLAKPFRPSALVDEVVDLLDRRARATS